MATTSPPSTSIPPGPSGNGSVGIRQPISSGPLFDALVRSATSGGAYTPKELAISATIDPNNASWAEFAVDAAPGYQSQVQAGIGLAQNVDGAWTVVTIGTGGVGCNGSAPQSGVPPSVLDDFGATCPQGVVYRPG